MTDPTDDQVAQEENPAEEAGLSKETLEDLDADQSTEDIKGGGVQSYRQGAC